MSATIQIKQSADSTPFFLYRTWKGFPEACGEAILCELESEYNWRAEKIATGLVQSKDEYGFLLFEIANGEYGDETGNLPYPNTIHDLFEKTIIEQGG